MLNHPAARLSIQRSKVRSLVDQAVPQRTRMLLGVGGSEADLHAEPDAASFVLW
jgi:hypothetical protein